MSAWAGLAGETVAEGRAEAEARMVDTCTIRHGPSGPGTYDSATGVHTPAAGDVVYEGPCEVQVTGAVAFTTPEAGETQVTLQQVVVKVPVSAAGIVVDDEVTIDAVGAASDPELVGKTYRVEATHAKTYATARRLQCEERTG